MMYAVMSGTQVIEVYKERRQAESMMGEDMRVAIMLTTTEASKRLGISEARVKQLLSSGVLTGTAEPFGPGKRWMIDADSVTKRKRQAKRGLPKGGRPKSED